MLTTRSAIATSTRTFLVKSPDLSFREALEVSLVKTRPGWSIEVLDDLSPQLDQAASNEEMLSIVCEVDEQLPLVDASRAITARRLAERFGIDARIYRSMAMWSPVRRMSMLFFGWGFIIVLLLGWLLVPVQTWLLTAALLAALVLVFDYATRLPQERWNRAVEDSLVQHIRGRLREH